MSKTRFNTYAIKYLEVSVNNIEIYNELVDAIRDGLCYDYAYPLDISAGAFDEAIANNDVWDDVESHIMEEIKAIHGQLDGSIDRIELV